MNKSFLADTHYLYAHLAVVLIVVNVVDVDVSKIRKQMSKKEREKEEELKNTYKMSSMEIFIQVDKIMIKCAYFNKHFTVMIISWLLKLK